MSIPRRAQQRDANEPDIVRAFERLHWQVQRHAAYDLEVQAPCFSGCHFSVEVKNRGGRNRPTASQEKLVRDGWRLEVVYEVADVVAFCKSHLKLCLAVR